MKPWLVRLACWAVYALAGIMLFSYGLFYWIYAKLSSTPGVWYHEIRWVSHASEGVAALTFTGMALLGTLIVRRKPRNPVGWLVLSAGSLGLLGKILLYYYPVFESGTIPGLRFPSFMIWLGGLGPLHVSLIGLLLFLLFPDGRLPSKKWRPIAAFATLLIVIRAADLSFGPSSFAPPFKLGALDVLRYGLALGGRYVTIDGLLRVIGITIASAALISKLRRSEGTERQQLKWFAVAAVVAASVAVGNLFFFLAGGVSREVFDTLNIARNGSLLALTAATALAIFKYRLYDIDVIIRKGTVFGILGLFIGAVYSLTILSLGSVLGGNVGSGSVSLLVPMGIVAVGTHPVRVRAEKFASRLVFGERSAPFVVLSRLAERIAMATGADSLVSEIALIAGQAVSAISSRVVIFVPSAPDFSGEWVALGDRKGASELWTTPIFSEGLDIGIIEVLTRPGALTRDDKRLLRQLADQTGTALASVRLTHQLHRTLELSEQTARELARSQERLVTAHLATRQRLEQVIHEGPRRRLEEVRVRLVAIAESEEKDAIAAPPALQSLVEQTRLIWEDLRRFSRDVHGSSVEEVGITSALQTLIEEEELDADVEVDHSVSSSRYPSEIEAAIFEACSEVLHAVAPLTPLKLSLKAVEGRIKIAITEVQGAFSTFETLKAEILRRIEDRIIAVGGFVGVGDGPVIISGEVPVPSPAERVAG